ncbi:unnamed protein product [Trypanosoma congolense IL3000]|uniref:WGS project CAEQ00000000 data, annotated contig 1642 n=1 Tax=Trypanosoma congolense (strain IL3000) TaxID=1068625 RepID=F9W7Q9_TRYCI|nr:unnamed protein product [Trypanosoma congolense IL3000]
MPWIRRRPCTNFSSRSWASCIRWTDRWATIEAPTRSIRRLGESFSGRRVRARGIFRLWRSSMWRGPCSNRRTRRKKRGSFSVVSCMKPVTWTMSTIITKARKRFSRLWKKFFRRPPRGDGSWENLFPSIPMGRPHTSHRSRTQRSQQSPTHKPHHGGQLYGSPFRVPPEHTKHSSMFMASRCRYFDLIKLSEKHSHLSHKSYSPHTVFLFSPIPFSLSPESRNPD